jgi:hypothetical protein
VVLEAMRLPPHHEERCDGGNRLSAHAAGFAFLLVFTLIVGAASYSQTPPSERLWITFRDQRPVVTFPQLTQAPSGYPIEHSGVGQKFCPRKSSSMSSTFPSTRRISVRCR